jgi:hypothetical protein
VIIVVCCIRLLKNKKIICGYVGSPRTLGSSGCLLVDSGPTYEPETWLLVTVTIVHSVPCRCGHFLIYFAIHLTMSSNHSQFIHQSYLLWLQQRQLVAKEGEGARNGR